MKKNIYKIIILSVIGICIANPFYSQSSHELSVVAGSGLSKLVYKTDLGKSSYGYNGLFGLGYSYFFTKKFGLNTGVECSFYHSNIRTSQFSTTETGLIDDEGDTFDYYATVENYREKQQATLLTIPFMLQYQANGKHKFYVAAGGKIGIPVSSKFNGSQATFINKGYYPAQDNWLETQKFAGFGTFTDQKAEGKLNLKTTFIASVETGMKWQIGTYYLYSGIYMDYGLSDIIKNNRKESFIAYNHKSPSDISSRSVLNSTFYQNQKQTPITDKVAPLAFGVKLRFAFCM